MKKPAHRAETPDGAESVRIVVYIADAPVFAQPVLMHLRKLVHCASPEITEEIKWRQPFFLHRGALLCFMAAFKQHCSFGFWGPEMGAVMKQDGRDGEDGAKGSRGAFGRILSVGDLPSDQVMMGYLRQAVALAESGVVTPFKASKSKPESQRETPSEFVAAMKTKPGAEDAFAMLSASCRREYIDWIVEAKRSETRDRRIQTAVQWIAEGKSRNWKYENC